MTVTPEMLNDESVERALIAAFMCDAEKIRAAITAYLNAEIEAGRGKDGMMKPCPMPDGRNVTWVGGSYEIVDDAEQFPVLILRPEAGKEG